MQVYINGCVKMLSESVFYTVKFSAVYGKCLPLFISVIFWIKYWYVQFSGISTN
jgi:hypothetical protein